MQKCIIKEEVLRFKMIRDAIIYDKYYWRYASGNVVWSVRMKISKLPIMQCLSKYMVNNLFSIISIY